MPMYCTFAIVAGEEREREIPRQWVDADVVYIYKRKARKNDPNNNQRYLPAIHYRQNPRIRGV